MSLNKENKGGMTRCGSGKRFNTGLTRTTGLLSTLKRKNSEKELLHKSTLTTRRC